MSGEPVPPPRGMSAGREGPGPALAGGAGRVAAARADSMRCLCGLLRSPGSERPRPAPRADPASQA